VEPWLTRLEDGDADGAWDVFLDRYRRLIFATIRHFVTEYDDVMDVFAQVCGALRENDLVRLRRYAAEKTHRARFSTWLVAVVRNQTIDWFRHRDGRKRLSAAAAALPPVQQKIFHYVFTASRSHVEAYELLRSKEGIELSFGEFLRELSATYRAVGRGRAGNLLRELGGPPPPDLDEAAVTPAPTADSRERLAEALAALDPDVRAAVQLFVVDEVPAADIARMVGWPNAKAVYNRVYRALAALRTEDL
jgi:RNA polymerase sigma factor (sigma-70 family)